MSTQFPGLEYVVSPMPAYPDYADHEFSVQLAGNTYLFRMQWNDFGGYWAMSIYDPDGTPRVEGRKLVPGWQPVDKLPQANPEDGMLTVLGTDGLAVPYEQADLGNKLQLTFITLARE